MFGIAALPSVARNDQRGLQLSLRREGMRGGCLLPMTESNRADAGASGMLCITVPADRIACFFPLLQKGVALEVSLDRPIRSLLRDELGLTEEYIDTSIQTVFLDGKPVDDIDGALIRDGSTLALAPAMPGLMGAMLRRGGYYALMRSGITHRDDAAPQGVGQGRIVMKLFGMALRELGPMLLERGIEVDAGDLAQIVSELPGECLGGLGDLEGLERQGRVLLQVSVAPEREEGTRD